MDTKTKSILCKIVRIAMPVIALILGCLPGSYERLRLVTNTATGEAVYEAYDACYFGYDGTLIDWLPLICMLLCIAAVIMASICAVKETVKNLVLLGHMLCIPMVAALMIVILNGVSVHSILIVTALAVALAITAVQEMRLEDAGRM